MTRNLTIAVFGRLADSLGHEFAFDLDLPCSVAEFRKRLAGAFPLAGGDLLDRRVRVCVADTVAPDSFVIAEERRIEILSPLSGG